MPLLSIGASGYIDKYKLLKIREIWMLVKFILKEKQN